MRTHFGLRALLVCAALFLPAPAHAGPRKAALDLSAGLQIPFSRENRDLLGTGVVISAGLPTRLSDSGWMILDVAFLYTAGRLTVPDPTFEMAETRLWLVPITLGWRFNSATRGEDRASRLYLGFGFQSWLTWYADPGAPTLFQPAFGVMAEWRHELDLGRRSTLFVRQRFMATTSQRYDRRVSEIGFSGTTLEFGLSRRLR